MTSLDEPDAMDVKDERPRIDDEIADAEQAEHLRKAVMQLPEDLRFTVTAHFWGGLSVKEIAEIEKITTVAIRKRLHRAFSMLEATLDEEVQ
jgi:RNA polymerase sigma factor (sigma-70 family)